MDWPIRGLLTTLIVSCLGNPMRLVRRHGRIGRIGSQHSEVFIHCVFSDARLDDLLGLAERLHRRLTRAAAGIGIGVGGVPA